jgi:hypothetical protein
MAIAKDKTSTVKTACRALAVLFMFSAASCGSSKSDAVREVTKRAYQLCPKDEDARARLIELARAFAAQHGAQIVDRGLGAQSELAAIASDTLRSTTLPLVLVTIEKPGRFRVSITNVGLREKFALSVRLWNASSEYATNAFLNDVKRFWSVEEVEGGIENDQTCPSS